MSIEFQCSGCGRVLRTPDGAVGKNARCPQCGAIVPVPSASTWTGDQPAPAPGNASSFGSSAGASPPANPFAGSAGGPFGPSNTSSTPNPFASNPFGESNPFAPTGPTAGSSHPGAPLPSNPYAAPSSMASFVPTTHMASREIALSKVAAPAIALMIFGGLGLALQMVAIVAQIAMNARGDDVLPAVLGGGLAIATGSLILVGGLKMKRLETYGLAMAAAVLAIIPCFSPCCVIGIPIGTWAIVVLNDAAVKNAFR